MTMTEKIQKFHEQYNVVERITQVVQEFEFDPKALQSVADFEDEDLFNENCDSEVYTIYDNSETCYHVIDRTTQQMVAEIHDPSGLKVFIENLK